MMKVSPLLRRRSWSWIYVAIAVCVALFWWFVAPNLYRQNPLYKSLIASDTEAVRSRIKSNPAELEHRFFGLNATPLHVAAERGDTNMINVLLSLGADIEAKGYRNLATPLHCAAVRGRKAAVQVLLAHGADVNARDRDEKTPLHDAAWSDNPEIIRLLAEHGGDINAEAPTGGIPAEPPCTPLIEAVEYERAKACRALLDLGARADFGYLLGLVEQDRSVAPLAPKARLAEWDAITTILGEFRERRSAQKDGAANGSQPIRSETNRTSSAAVSRR